MYVILSNCLYFDALEQFVNSCMASSISSTFACIRIALIKCVYSKLNKTCATISLFIHRKREKKTPCLRVKMWWFRSNPLVFGFVRLVSNWKLVLWDQAVQLFLLNTSVTISLALPVILSNASSAAANKIDWIRMYSIDNCCGIYRQITFALHSSCANPCSHNFLHSHIAIHFCLSWFV